LAVTIYGSDLTTPSWDSHGQASVHGQVGVFSTYVPWPTPCPDLEGDTTPPEVSNYDPVEGTTIEADDNLQFDVTDNLGVFTRTIVSAKFSNGVEEVVHDGDNFNEYYSTYSARTVITNGYHYNIRRTYGWPSSPVVIKIYAIDTDGNEAV
jgi:hypothetical protein